jgi:hypothetical protein
MTVAWPASRGYVVQSLGLWAFFLLSIALLSWGSGGRLPQSALWALALAHAGSVALQFALAYRLVSLQDEFIRAIIAKRMLAAAGLTVTAAVLASVLEQFLGVPRLPMWLIYPFFWGAFGMVTPFVRSSRP